MAKFAHILAAITALLGQCLAAPPAYCSYPPAYAQGTAAPGNKTAKNNKLQTWWHNTGEINTETAVQDGNVRQSHMYDIQVSTAGSKKWFDTFVYESIPRNGNGQIDYVGGPISTATNDGISIEPVVGINMAWTQFLYASDVVVKITRKDGSAPFASDVVIRPTTIDYQVDAYCGSIYITVPYNPDSTKFSVEFQDDLWEYYSQNSSNTDIAKYVQNVDPNGVNYVPNYDSSDLVSIEPLNGLLIFASPFPPGSMIPSKNAKKTYVVPTGLVTGLESITESTVYFGPGVYWFTGLNHAILSSSVNWVYLAPGAYVKGAVQYSTSKPVIKATGYGVLSGEQYVYQCNPALGYINSKSDATSLRLWSGIANAGQNFILHGPTSSAPPFNSMDFFGDNQHFTSDVFDYKQTGAFFWQTDGIEIYPGSHVRDIFYHTNDDTVKSYYSNVLIERIVNWKVNNDPVIQMGWYPRNLTNITINDLSVIHARYFKDDRIVVAALIGESPNYLNAGATNDAFTTWNVNNYTINNLRCEGICPALLRLNPLQGFDNFTVNGARIDAFPARRTGMGESFVKAFTDANGTEVELGAFSPGGVGITIRDFFVGGTQVSLEADNWRSDQLGRLDIDASYWGHWTVE